MAEDSDDEIAKEARRRVSRHRGPGASSVAPKVEKLLGLRPSSEAQLELLQGEDAALRELEALRCVFCRSYHGRGAWDEPEGAEAEGEGGELCDDCASESSERSPWAGDAGSVEPTWRLRERMKTVSVALVLCLNIGTDPPDAVAASPRARRECWLEPFAGPSRQKALETIGAALQAQYERWQSRARYRQLLDPTADELRRLCAALRRSARGDRVLVHLNGHGVPRPTANGEVWVFNKNYTQYIPLSVYELRSVVRGPAVYVLDCGGAGVLLPHFTAPMPRHHDRNPGDKAPDDQMGGDECIVLAPCGADEALPSDPGLPADLFTACLTTPIAVALRAFGARGRRGGPPGGGDAADVPGRLGDRKTPLGELNWIFTAVTDTIAWNVLPAPLFQRLFRQDLLLASLFRNFLLAERVLKAHGCTPATLAVGAGPSPAPAPPPAPGPAPPPAGDGARRGRRRARRRAALARAGAAAAAPGAEVCDGATAYGALRGLRGLATLREAPPRPLEPSPFFEEQLTAFEVWLAWRGWRARARATRRGPSSCPSCSRPPARGGESLLDVARAPPRRPATRARWARALAAVAALFFEAGDDVDAADDDEGRDDGAENGGAGGDAAAPTLLATLARARDATRSRAARAAARRATRRPSCAARRPSPPRPSPPRTRATRRASAMPAAWRGGRRWRRDAPPARAPKAAKLLGLAAPEGGPGDAARARRQRRGLRRGLGLPRRARRARSPGPRARAPLADAVAPPVDDDDADRVGESFGDEAGARLSGDDRGAARWASRRRAAARGPARRARRWAQRRFAAERRSASIAASFRGDAAPDGDAAAPAAADGAAGAARRARAPGAAAPRQETLEDLLLDDPWPSPASCGSTGGTGTATAAARRARPRSPSPARATGVSAWDHEAASSRWSNGAARLDAGGGPAGALRGRAPPPPRAARAPARVARGRRRRVAAARGARRGRATCVEWLNAQSSTLLLVGSDDGAARIWGGLRLEASDDGARPAAARLARAAPARTVDVQNSTMTAFDAHGNAPLLASGSHNQFIKFMARDGDQLNIVRYHDGFLGQRIGPVSSLAFHPTKVLCAAGSTDAVVGIYAAQ
ncbi:hypothetical protein SO694_00009154 [Aureococcus anophagefferens]|uniref:Raptor N-terminal CASPase-like domain-containing protein n=1 Tax=Aureococcus anophagefferens TaxID=44056 RepID=A0ABR1GDV0_AURAN